MKSFKGDFEKMLDMLEKNEYFAFTRFSDGELYILQNKEIWIKNNTCHHGRDGQVHQGWWGEEELKSFIPDQDQELRDKLIECFSHKQLNYFKGICCKCCVGEKDWAWQFKNLLDPEEPHLTWSNVLINGNYYNFMTKMLPVMQQYDVVYTCNKMANLKQFPLNLKKDFRVGQNCHINDIQLVEQMKEWVDKNKIENHLFLFSAASLSNILIYELYKEFPNNTYMDIGSTLNPMLDLNGWMGSRGYLKGYWLKEQQENYFKYCVW